LKKYEKEIKKIEQIYKVLNLYLARRDKNRNGK